MGFSHHGGWGQDTAALLAWHIPLLLFLSDDNNCPELVRGCAGIARDSWLAVSPGSQQSMTQLLLPASSLSVDSGRLGPGQAGKQQVYRVLRPLRLGWACRARDKLGSWGQSSNKLKRVCRPCIGPISPCTGLCWSIPALSQLFPAAQSPAESRTTVTQLGIGRGERPENTRTRGPMQEL